MPVTFAINSVLDRLAKSVIAALAAQGEPPQSLPRATTAEQAAFHGSDLPATILGIGEVHFSEENADIGSLRFCQELTLHHIRPLLPGGSAVETGTARMSAVATALYRDYRLEGVSAPGDQPVETARSLGMAAGDKNEVQQLLDQADQAGSLCVISLRLELDWVESPEPAPIASSSAFPA